MVTAQVTLTHNVGEIVPSNLFSCSPSDMARTFTLQDFGVADNVEFIIDSAEIAYQVTVEKDLGAFISLYVYAIDDNFPTSFPQSTLLGTQHLVQLETTPTNNGLTPMKTLRVNFNIPVIVPPEVKRILVVVEEKLWPNSLHLATTEEETDSSWLKGGCPPYQYHTTDDFGYPDAHFYLKVFGKAQVPSGCTPLGYSGVSTICDPDGDGITQFETAHIEGWAGGIGKDVSYFDGQGVPLPSPLPHPYTNTTPYEEVITVRVTDPLTGECRETTMTFRTEDPLDAQRPPDQYACDEGDGFGQFDLSQIESQIIGTQTGLSVTYSDVNGMELPDFPSTSYRNQEPYSQTVYVKVTFGANPVCFLETSFDLIVTPRPTAHPLEDLVMPDDDGNGFAQFDTNHIESTVIGGQTGVEVSYYNGSRVPLPNPLPNPYTNTVPNQETITVRVTDPLTGCFAETALSFRTANTPGIGNPSDLYACDEGDGYAHFDVSSIEAQIIGQQTGLRITYYDTNGLELTHFPVTYYRNQTPHHQTVTAIVTDNNDPAFRAETAFDLIVTPLPMAHALQDLIVCDADGIANFDISGVEGAAVGNQTGMEVAYFNGSGVPLPNPYTNTVPNQETITVRVTDPLTGCYAETPLNLRTSNPPIVSRLPNLYAYNEGDGHALFDVSSIASQILNGRTGLHISYLDAHGTELPGFPSTSYRNQDPYSQTITIRVEDNHDAGCYAETAFDLIVIPRPVAHALPNLIVCDEDGFTDFDISGVKSAVLGDQVEMEVAFFDAQGVPIPYPRSNWYTNAVPYRETITVRVTDPRTGGYDETPLILQTSIAPIVAKPADLYACDEGEGYAQFDVSEIIPQIIGEQTGLNITYLDSNGQALSNFNSNSYRNRIPFSETIGVRVAHVDHPECYSETYFDLIIERAPIVDLQPIYYVCDQEPSRIFTADPEADSWAWVAEDGSVLSDTFEVTLAQAGHYTLYTTHSLNGISCGYSASFQLVVADAPTIQKVKTDNFSGNGLIEILATGTGELEYSIDGEHYQKERLFQGLPEGLYTVYARNLEGCGQDFQEVVLLDFPKFFSPNGDGTNDYWQIKALDNFPGAVIHIFDRYGKLLKEIRPNELGWDGTFNGRSLPPSDYWFSLDLGNGKEFKNHFTLKH